VDHPVRAPGAGRTDPPGRTELDGAADCGSGPAPRPLVAASLLHPGGAGACTRLVVREPRISRIQVAGLAAGAVPPFIALVTDVRGRRCIEDAGTGEPVSGRPDQVTWFYEFWQLVRDGPAPAPGPPAVIASLTRSSGLSDWRPDLTSMSVRGLLG